MAWIQPMLYVTGWMWKQAWSSNGALFVLLRYGRRKLSSIKSGGICLSQQQHKRALEEHTIRVLTTACVVRVHAPQASTHNREWALSQLHSSGSVNPEPCRRTATSDMSN